LKKVAAVVVAGGRGERCAKPGALPKQLLLLAGEPVFIWSLRTICQHAEVAEVVLVVPGDLQQAFEENVQRHLQDYVDKVKFVSGGPIRQASVLAGLEFLAQQPGGPPKFVLVHDAARPFLDRGDLDKVIAGLKERRGCTLAQPLSDTLKQVENEVITGTIARQGLYSVQTPQAADFVSMVDAHRLLDKAGIETTDDAAVLERIGVPVAVIIGSSLNFKITTTEDLQLAQAIAANIKDNNKVRHYI
jgi:2-C-methyl-D-erythritol 4-phosphate cytidylyltransferase